MLCIFSKVSTVASCLWLDPSLQYPLHQLFVKSGPAGPPHFPHVCLYVSPGLHLGLEAELWLNYKNNDFVCLHFKTWYELVKSVRQRGPPTRKARLFVSYCLKCGMPQCGCPCCCQHCIIKPWCQVSAQVITNYNPKQSGSLVFSEKGERTGLWSTCLKICQSLWLFAEDFWIEYGFLTEDPWINMDFCVSNIHIAASVLQSAAQTFHRLSEWQCDVCTPVRFTSYWSTGTHLAVS